MRFVFLLFCAFSFCTLAEEASRDLTSAEIKFVRIHTSNHSVETAQKTVLVGIPDLNAACSRGVFVILENDPETYSTILAALSSERNIRVGFEITKKTPWGDNTYCALTYMDIKN